MWDSVPLHFVNTKTISSAATRSRGCCSRKKGKRQDTSVIRSYNLRPTKEIERAFENFIFGQGLPIAPVTMDILDWIFMVAYANARTQRDSDLMKRVSDEYLKFGGLKLEFCEQVTDDLFEHLIRQILLLHVNELNADNLDGLVMMLKRRGYQFITLERALKDSVSNSRTNIRTPLTGWLVIQQREKRLRRPKPPEFIERYIRTIGKGSRLNSEE